MYEAQLAVSLSSTTEKSCLHPEDRSSQIQCTEDGNETPWSTRHRAPKLQVRDMPQSGGLDS
jgi:hypothetical protein